MDYHFMEKCKNEKISLLFIKNDKKISWKNKMYLYTNLNNICIQKKIEDEHSP